MIAKRTTRRHVDKPWPLGRRSTCARQEWIREQQRRLWPPPLVERTARDFRRLARWWELEALRGYDHIVMGTKLTSAKMSRRYAANMRWAAELATEFGPGRWPELLARSGAKAPDVEAADFWDPRPITPRRNGGRR